METVKIEFQGVKAGDFKTDSSSLTVTKDSEGQAKALVQAVYDAADHIDELRGQIDVLEGEKAMLKQDAEVGPERLDEMVKERTDALDVAEHAGLKADDLKGDGVNEIKRKIVATRTDLDPDASDDFVQGCFNMIRADAAKTLDNRNKLRKLGDNTSGRADAADLEREAKDDVSYREAAEAHRQDVHLKTPEEIRRDGRPLPN